MLIKLAGVRPVSCFTARITVSLRSALSWASLSSDATPADPSPGAETAGRWRDAAPAARRRTAAARAGVAPAGGQLFKAPAAHQGDNLLETGKERAVAQQRLRRGDTGARGNIRALRVAPCRVQVKHVIAARPAMQRITAMRRVRRDHDQIPGLQQVLLASAQARVSPSIIAPTESWGWLWRL
ncbi:Uncharacterised protein [Klebsiella pneumoniae]|nr:Uncharacterised protein [Klebsiella pneumoniae]